MTENHEALEFASDDLKRDSDVIGLFVEKNDDKDENDMASNCIALEYRLFNLMLSFQARENG
eukprot:4111559-Ditylum_brightwellii.AAC.1